MPNVCFSATRSQVAGGAQAQPADLQKNEDHRQTIAYLETPPWNSSS